LVGGGDVTGGGGGKIPESWESWESWEPRFVKPPAIVVVVGAREELTIAGHHPRLDIAHTVVVVSS
jgi:hypothetical protein